MAKSNPAQTRARVSSSAESFTYLADVTPPDTVERDMEAGKKVSAPDEWSEFDKFDDRQIGKAVAKDRDAAPVGDDDVWKNARVIMPVPKQPISIRLDEDVVAFFKKSGPGYQSRMNAVLRSYMEAKK